MCCLRLSMHSTFNQLEVLLSEFTISRTNTAACVQCSTMDEYFIINLACENWSSSRFSYVGQLAHTFRQAISGVKVNA